MDNIANVSDGNKVAQLEWREEATADKKIAKVATSSKINFRGLTPNQIEVRPTGTTPKGQCTLLLYIDGRCAANILDETVGAYNWTIEYKPIGDKVFGRLSIYDEDRNIWIHKEDTGAESNIEADKGLSSDILKRCLARWGCNHLYSAPKINIKCPDNYYYNDKMTMTFSIKSIDYIGKQISQLTIVDRFDKVVFDWSLNNTKAPVYNSTINHYEAPKPYMENNVCSGVMSNEDKLKAFVDAQRGKYDDYKLDSFFKFFMKEDNCGNGKSIATNLGSKFNPEERFHIWLNKKNNN